MKKADVFPIWRAVENTIKRELAKQGLYLAQGKVKSTSTGKLTIEVLCEEFKPCTKDVK